MSQAAATPAGGAQALLGIGQVQHLRLRPRRHGFAYRTYFLLLPMRTLRRQPSTELPRNRFGLLSFHDADHGDGRPDSLAWLEERLTDEGVSDADGEVWLHCYPRVLGHTFKPVSFWYCHRADGSLAAVVVEVNNTFGERHCYLLEGPAVGFGRELRAHKAFHVSPFCRTEGDYRFRFMRTGLHPAPNASRNEGVGNDARTVARVELHDEEGPLVLTSVSGDLAPATRQRLRAAFVSMPLMTLAVVARIHWQALRLWLKRVPFISKPEPPQSFMTR